MIILFSLAPTHQPTNMVSSFFKYGSNLSLKNLDVMYFTWLCLLIIFSGPWTQQQAIYNSVHPLLSFLLFSSIVTMIAKIQGKNKTKQKRKKPKKIKYIKTREWSNFFYLSKISLWGHISKNPIHSIFIHGRFFVIHIWSKPSGGP